MLATQDVMGKAVAAGTLTPKRSQGGPACGSYDILAAMQDSTTASPTGVAADTSNILPASGASGGTSNIRPASGANGGTSNPLFARGNLTLARLSESRTGSASSNEDPTTKGVVAGSSISSVSALDDLADIVEAVSNGSPVHSEAPPDAPPDAPESNTSRATVRIHLPIEWVSMESRPEAKPGAHGVTPFIFTMACDPIATTMSTLWEMQSGWLELEEALRPLQNFLADVRHVHFTKSLGEHLPAGEVLSSHMEEGEGELDVLVQATEEGQTW